MKILESPHRPLVLFHFKEQKSLKPQIVPHPQISNAFMKFSTERQQIQGREKEIPERCCRCREVKARSNGYCRDLRTTIIMPLFFSLLSAPLSLSLSPKSGWGVTSFNRDPTSDVSYIIFFSIPLSSTALQNF